MVDVLTGGLLVVEMLFTCGRVDTVNISIALKCFLVNPMHGLVAPCGIWVLVSWLRVTLMYSSVLVMSLELSVGLCGKELPSATISRFSSGPVVGTSVPTGVPDVIVVVFVGFVGFVVLICDVEEISKNLVRCNASDFVISRICSFGNLMHGLVAPCGIWVFVWVRLALVHSPDASLSLALSVVLESVKFALDIAAEATINRVVVEPSVGTLVRPEGPDSVFIVIMVVLEIVGAFVIVVGTYRTASDIQIDVGQDRSNGFVVT